MLRLIRRDPKRPADVFVTPSTAAPHCQSSDGSDREAATARAIPHPLARAIAEVLSPDDSPPSDMTAVSEELLMTSELIFDEDEPGDSTPATPRVPWARLIPPPLPESER